MGEWIGINRRARRCYVCDEISLVPGTVPSNPAEVDTTWELGDLKFRVPFIASAMDGVVDVRFAIAMGKLGGLAVLNLDGVQARYDDPQEAIAQLVKGGDVNQATEAVQHQQDDLGLGGAGQGLQVVEGHHREASCQSQKFAGRLGG